MNIYKIRKFLSIVYIVLLVCITSSCSLIPRINFDTPNTVPQQIDKSTIKDTCKGEVKFNELGEIIYCSKGYHSYSKNYRKEERKMTIVETVKSFFNNIFGWGIPGLIIICVLFPGAFTVIGTIIGRLFEGAFGLGVQTLRRVAKAVQSARKGDKDLNTELNVELDEKQKQYIRRLKEQEKIK